MAPFQIRRPRRLAQRKVATDSFAVSSSDREQTLASPRAIQVLGTYLRVYAADSNFTPAFGHEARPSSMVSEPQSLQDCAFKVFDGSVSADAERSLPSSPENEPRIYHTPDETRSLRDTEETSLLSGGKAQQSVPDEQDINCIDWANKYRAKKAIRALNVTEASEPEKLGDYCPNNVHGVSWDLTEGLDDGAHCQSEVDNRIEERDHRVSSKSEVVFQQEIAEEPGEAREEVEKRPKSQPTVSTGRTSHSGDSLRGRFIKGYYSVHQRLHHKGLGKDGFPPLPDARERRRRARDSREQHSSSGNSSPLHTSPISGGDSPPKLHPDMQYAASETDLLRLLVDPESEEAVALAARIPQGAMSPTSTQVPPNSPQLAFRSPEIPSNVPAIRGPYTLSSPVRLTSPAGEFTGLPISPVRTSAPAYVFPVSPDTEPADSQVSLPLPRKRLRRAWNRLQEMLELGREDKSVIAEDPVANTELSNGATTELVQMPAMELPNEAKRKGKERKGRDPRRNYSSEIEPAADGSSVALSSLSLSSCATEVPNDAQSLRPLPPVATSQPPSGTQNLDHSNEASYSEARVSRNLFSSTIEVLKASLRRRIKTTLASRNISVSGYRPIPLTGTETSVLELNLPHPINVDDILRTDGGQQFPETHDRDASPRRRVVRRNTAGTLRVLGLILDDESPNDEKEDNHEQCKRKRRASHSSGSQAVVGQVEELEDKTSVLPS